MTAQKSKLMKTTKNPNDEDWFANEGGRFEDAGDLNGAILEYSHGLSVFPMSARLFARRGRCYYLQKQHRLAIADFDKAIEIKSDAANTLFLRASSHEECGNLEMALRDYRMSVSFVKSADAFECIGLILKFRKELAAARHAFSEALDLDPENQRLKNLRDSV